MLLPKRQAQVSYLSTIAARSINLKNPIFSFDFICELYDLFCLYANPRTKKANIGDILITAKALNLDQKFQLVFKAIQQIYQTFGPDPIDFECFLRQLTDKIGNPYTQTGRKANFALFDIKKKGQLDINDLKYINQQLHYGYTENQLNELIKNVGGFQASTISQQKFNKLIGRKIKQRNAV